MKKKSFKRKNLILRIIIPFPVMALGQKMAAPSYAFGPPLISVGCPKPKHAASNDG